MSSKTDKQANDMSNNLFVFSLLFFTTTALYINSIHNSFAVVDDLQGYTQNPLIRDFSKALSTFNLQTMVYAVNYAFTGVNPLPLRILSFILHSTVGFLIYLLFKKIWNEKIAFIAAFLFILHPVNSEVMNWISGQFYAVIALILYIVLLLHVYFRTTHDKRFVFAYSIIFGVSLILIQHPWMLIIIPSLVIFDLLILRQKTDLAYFKLISMLLVPILLLYAFIYFGSNLKDRIASHDNSSGKILMNQQKLQPVTESYAYSISSMVRLYLFPKDLTIYYDGNPLTKLEYLSMFIIAMTYFGLIIYFWYKNRRISGILLLLLVFMAYVFSPKKYTWYITERYLYMGTGFFTLLLALLLNDLEKKIKWRYLTPVVVVAICLAYSYRTFLRNKDWKNPETLAFATIRTSPDSVRPYNDVAGYYYLNNNIDKSKEYYYKALEKYPSSTAMKNLGFIYTHAALPTNLPLSSKDPQELQRLAMESYSKGDFSTSMYYLTQLYSFNKRDPQLLLIISRVYIEGQNYEEAEKTLSLVESLDPKNPQIFLSRGYMAFKQGNKDLAISYLKKVLEIDPSNQEALTNLGALSSMH